MKNLLKSLDIEFEEEEELFIKGIMARVNEPEKKGGAIKIHFLVYSGEGNPKKQNQFIINYSKKYSPKFLNELLDAQKKGYELGVKGIYVPSYQRNITDRIDAEKLSIFPKQDL
jgi:hypothetical protein